MKRSNEPAVVRLRLPYLMDRLAYESLAVVESGKPASVSRGRWMAAVSQAARALEDGYDPKLIDRIYRYDGI